MGVTRADFATKWNARVADAQESYRIGPWTDLGASGKYRSFSAQIGGTHGAYRIWAVDYDGDQIVSAALAISPNVQAGLEVSVPGRFLDVLMSLFSADRSLLRELGVAFPFDPQSLAHVNSCTYLDNGWANYWTRLVQDIDGSGEIYLSFRAATDAEKTAGTAAKQEPETFAYPPLDDVTFASFAAPFSTLPVDGLNPDSGWATMVPSLVMTFKNEEWTHPFLATITPMPGGGNMYRFPAADGTALYTMEHNPFNAAQMASGVDPLKFLGAKYSSRTVDPAFQMISLLEAVVVAPTGEGLFNFDGNLVACSWVGGGMEPAKRGSFRSSVIPSCGDR
jgi:hypothetical protein